MRSRSTLPLLRRALASATALGVALAGAVALTTTPAQAAPKRFETPFAYQGSAYGTRVTLGDPNAGGLESGRTAWSLLGCTSMAPIHNANGSNVSRLNANSMIEVGAVTSSTSSYRMPKKRLYGSRSINRVAGLTLGPEGGPQLKFGAFTTIAHAYNDKGKFRAEADIDVLSVDYLNIPEAAGPLGQLLDAIDAADNQLIEAIIEGAGRRGITIPGLGTIYPAGTARTPSGPEGATANAFGIRVKLENGSEANIGRAWARIQPSYPAGVFAGHAYGLEAKMADGLLGVGRTPYQNLPCVGTEGKWRTNTLLDVPKNDNLNASVLSAETFGRPFRDGRAVARARSEVANLTLGGGALEIQGVVGQVNVFQNRKGRVVGRTVDGTRVGAIIANGEAQELPPPGEELVIDGLASIRAGVRQNLGKRGVRVYALRIELLDGTGLVLNVGAAQAKILR